MIIDSHGHYTTAPAGMQIFRATQVAFLGNPVKHPVTISDEQIKASLDNGQLKLQDERGTDVALFSPRASHMGHHFGDAKISQYWTEVNNELIDRVCKIYPDRFIPVAALPQSPGVPPIEGCVQELERCVTEFGMVGCNLNPDPSGGYWQDPPLGNEYWYPLYEKMVELDVPAMIHGSASCNPALHTTGSHYLNVDTTGLFQLMESTVLEDFPGIKFIFPHGGGALPFQYARFRGLSIMAKREPLEDWIKKVYFDTAIYSQDAVEYLLKIVGVDNVLFASEMIGGVQAIDPDTGRWFDDTKPYIDNIDWLTDEDKTKLFETNVQKVYPRMKAHLDKIAKK
jgi:4-oxalmesaconate hydratase